MSSLFSTALSKVRKPLPVALNTLFKVSRRQVYFQDVLFGMENERNLERLLKQEKSAGPSMIMNAVTYGIKVPFITDQKTIQGNDDTTRVFGLNPLNTVPDEYCKFPESVINNVQIRNGTTEVSFQYSGNDLQWNPDMMIEYCHKYGLEGLSQISSYSLFKRYLKKRGASSYEVGEMFKAVYRKNLATLDDPYKRKLIEQNFIDNDPTKNLKLEIQEYLYKDVCDAEILPSFTDIENGLFFLVLPPSKRYNMFCVLQGGHLIKTEEVASRLQELMKLKEENSDEYAIKIEAFMEATRGDTGKIPRSEQIVNSFRKMPLFEFIFQQNSNFMARNFEALCVKIDGYLLNLVKSNEQLIVNLQFPFVFGGAPAFVTLLVSVDENDGVKVEELFTDSSDPLSITAKSVDPRFANSIKYCGTPSANICILENRGQMESRFAEVSSSLRALVKDETSDRQIFINRTNALFSAFSDPLVKLRYLNGKPLAISSKDENWNDICRAIDATGLITTKYALKKNPPKTMEITFEWYSESLLNDDVQDVPVSDAIENYDWPTILTYELSEKFMVEKAKQLNELPSGFVPPTAYPEHIGAASPLNPMNDTGESLTEETFNILTGKD